MKTRYDDSIFKFKSRLLESAAIYKNYKNTLADVNAYDLNSEEGLEQLYLDLKKVRNYEYARVARYVNEYHLPAYDNINTIQKKSKLSTCGEGEFKKGCLALRFYAETHGL